MNNTANAPATAGPVNAGNVNKFCRIALNIAEVYAIQEPLPVKTPFNAMNAVSVASRGARLACEADPVGTLERALLALMALSAMTAL
jgi:hypothetical protein